MSANASASEMLRSQTLYRYRGFDPGPHWGTSVPRPSVLYTYICIYSPQMKIPRAPIGSHCYRSS